MLSFLRALVCFPSSSADYGLLAADDKVSWPIASFPPPPGPITRLPPELLQLIIRCIDATTLSSCSLVCGQWMAHARPLMFARISISIANANRFARLFTSPAPVTFSPYVREIELDELIIGDFFVSDVLPKFVVTFTHLDTLTLFAVPTCHLPLAFRGVSHLELNFSPTAGLCQAPHRLTSFIASFPRLESLKVAQEYGTCLRCNPSSEVRPPSCLRRLDLDNHLLLPWIVSSIPHAPLTYLRLDLSSAESLQGLDCLRRLSPSLRSLELILSDLEVGASFLDTHHLSANTQLHSLRLQADHSQAAPILLSLLSHIDTSTLSSISLDFAIPYLDDSPVPLVPWDALDALDALPALRRLTVAKVLVSPHGWRSRINQRTVLLELDDCMLPLCRQSGCIPLCRQLQLTSGNLSSDVGVGVGLFGALGPHTHTRTLAMPESNLNFEQRSLTRDRAAAGSPRSCQLTDLRAL
ncbi:hypothetical protein C8R46DRAFT_93397 [Mycena filopes]|nr:hypothetical protein C8R46DRAFT_93397 [Mycena filopes]